MDLPFKNKFDYIVAFNSLHWVSETKQALEQIREALVPGGQALILVAPIQVRHPLHQIINQVAKGDKWKSYFNKGSNVFSFHTLAKWATLIEEAHLIPENLQLIDASLDYKDTEAFAESMVAWIPFESIPESKKQEYIDDVVESYISVIPCGPNGEVHYLLDELVVVVSKPLER
jgi:trans-aconitate methyltransferase